MPDGFTLSEALAPQADAGQLATPTPNPDAPGYAPVDQPEAQPEPQQTTNFGYAPSGLAPDVHDRAILIYQDRLSRGDSPSQAIGVAANAVVESKADPYSARSSTGAAGTFQWLGSRLRNYKLLYGHDPEQGNLQEHLDFLDWENNNTESESWKKVQRAPDDPVSQAKAFRTHWERPGRDPAEVAKEEANAASVALKLWRSISGGRAMAAEPVRQAGKAFTLDDVKATKPSQPFSLDDAQGLAPAPAAKQAAQEAAQTAPVDADTPQSEVTDSQSTWTSQPTEMESRSAQRAAGIEPGPLKDQTPVDEFGNVGNPLEGLPDAQPLGATPQISPQAGLQSAPHPSAPWQTSPTETLPEARPNADLVPGPVDRIANAAREGWSSVPNILTDKAEKYLKDKGVPDSVIGFINSPSYVAAALSGGFKGFQQEVQETLTPIIGEQGARDTAGGLEAFMAGPHFPTGMGAGARLRMAGEMAREKVETSGRYAPAMRDYLENRETPAEAAGRAQREEREANEAAMSAAAAANQPKPLALPAPEGTPRGEPVAEPAAEPKAAPAETVAPAEQAAASAEPTPATTPPVEQVPPKYPQKPPPAGPNMPHLERLRPVPPRAEPVAPEAAVAPEVRPPEAAPAVQPESAAPVTPEVTPEATPESAPKPTRIRTLQQIMDEDGLTAAKAKVRQDEEIEAIGKPISMEEMGARRAGVPAAKPEVDRPVTEATPSAPDVPQPVPEPTGQSPSPAPSGAYVMVTPDQLTVDPERFQYKASGEGGVTGALQGVERWETGLANPITAWQGVDGKLYVVNGHQRTDLATRAVANGQTDVQMPARVYREADGYTPDYMKRLGAYQNIAEGSGTALDAAKVMRGAADGPAEFRLPDLPPRSQLVQQGKALANLSDQAFGVVENGIVPEAYAAHVGAMIKDPTEQMAALDVLARAHPPNSEQARLMVKDVRDSGFLNGSQTTLFGEEAFSHSLIPERARVLDNAMRTLRRLTGVFKAAVEGEGTLTAAGNSMNPAANSEAKTQNARLLDILQRDATTRGPISDALSIAARELADGKPVAGVASRFLAATRGIVARGGQEGVQSGAAPGSQEHPAQGEPGPDEQPGLAGVSESPVPLFSAVERATDGLKQARGTGEQMLSQIMKTPGVKPEEVKWMGLDDWLKGQKTVTRDQIADFVRANNLDVQEVMHGGDTPQYKAVKKEIEALGLDFETTSINRLEGIGAPEDLIERFSRYVIRRGGTNTRYSEYTLPGGENYREMLITLPPENAPARPVVTKAMLDDQALVRHGMLYDELGDHAQEDVRQDVEADLMSAGADQQYSDTPPGTFQSTHWNEPNVVAHIRFNERTAPDGKKVLLVEEVQSDWHQAGRRGGYRMSDAEAQQLATREQELIAKGRDATPAEKQEWADIRNRQQANGNAVPDAPFKTTWPALAMRRVTKFAVDNGFDRVAWPPGQVHADRYDLSQQISRVVLHDNHSGGVGRAVLDGPFTHGIVSAYDHGGRRVIEKPVESERELADTIGKETAEKLLAASASGATDGGLGARRRTLSGLDLKVGGAGMAGFYDKILPAETAKIIGKFGAKIGKSEVQVGHPDRDKVKPDAQAIADHGPEWDRVTAEIKDLESQRKPYSGNTPEENRLYDRLDQLHEKMIDDTMARGKAQEVHSFDVTPQMRDVVQREGLSLFERRPPIPSGPDLFGAVKPERARPTAEPTIRTDQRQQLMPGMEPSAVQAQAARDQAARGALNAKVPQKSADEGLFSRPQPEQPNLAPEPLFHQRGAANLLDTVPSGGDPTVVSRDWVLSKGKDGKEYLTVVGPAGDIVMAISGGKANLVPIDLRNVRHMPDDSIVIHHNHPAGSSFSGDDLAIGLTPQVRTMVVHTTDNVFIATSRTRLPDGWTESQLAAAQHRIKVVQKAAAGAVKGFLTERIKDGKLSVQEASDSFWDMVNRSLHVHGQIDYVSTRAVPASIAPAWTESLRGVANGDRARLDGATNAVQRDKALAGVPVGGGGAPRSAAAVLPVDKGRTSPAAGGQRRSAPLIPQGRLLENPVPTGWGAVEGGHGTPVLEAAQSAANAVAKMLGGKVRVAVVDGGLQIENANGIRAPRLVGGYALGRLIRSELSPNTPWVLNHEAIHALRNLGVFTPHEWSLLEKAAEKEEWLGQHKVEERYGALSKDKQIEEAIADHFGHYSQRPDLPKSPLLTRMMDKLRDWMRRLRSYMRGDGFRTAEDVFGDVESGKVGAREPGSGMEQRGPRSIEDSVMGAKIMHPQDMDVRLAVTPGVAPPGPPPSPGTARGIVKRIMDRPWPEATSEVVTEFLAPMHLGTPRSADLAFQFANHIRLNQMEFRSLATRMRDEFPVKERWEMGRAQAQQSVFEHKLARELEAQKPADRAAYETAARARFDATSAGYAGLSDKARAQMEALTSLADRTWQDLKDRGMVAPEAQGWANWMPRQLVIMENGKARRIVRSDAVLSGKGSAPGWPSGRGKLAELHPFGTNMTTKGPGFRDHEEVEETLKAARLKFGPNVELVDDALGMVSALERQNAAIAGHDLLESMKDYGKQVGAVVAYSGGNQRDGFTMAGHPSMYEVKPRFETNAAGETKIVTDADGKTVFDRVPVWIHEDFRAPLDAVFRAPMHKIMKAFMGLKALSTHFVMQSPLTHLWVELGRAAPLTAGGKFMVLSLGAGRRARMANDPRIRELVRHGMAPISQGFIGDPESLMNEANHTTPFGQVGRAVGQARDLLAQGVQNLPAGEFASKVIRRPIQTLLWNRVLDLQIAIGLGVAEDRLKAGWTPTQAYTAGGHLANRYAGALPPEGMSRLMNAISNVFLFSRSFTGGNIGVMKDMITGSPQHITGHVEQADGPEAAAAYKEWMRHKASKTFVGDVILYWGMLALTQSAISSIYNSLTDNKDAGSTSDGYVRRFHNALHYVGEHPVRAMWVPNVISSLLPSADNEPGKENRVRLWPLEGTKQYLYARLPPGKVGEEFLSWIEDPFGTLTRKQSTFLKGADQTISGKNDFGQDIRRPGEHSMANTWRSTKVFLDTLFPTQIQSDMYTAAGRPGSSLWGAAPPTSQERKLAGLQTLGAATGMVQFSRGYPSGPLGGEAALEESQMKFDVRQVMPEVKRLAEAGRDEEARALLRKAGEDERTANRMVSGMLPENREGAADKRENQQIKRVAKRGNPENMSRMQSIQQSYGLSPRDALSTPP